MRRLSFAAFVFAAFCPLVWGQFTFNIVGSDASQTVTVSASGTVTATGTSELSPGARFWNGYGDMWLSTASYQAFTIGSGITLTNTTRSRTTGIASLAFNNSASSGDGDIFQFENGSSFSIISGETLTLSGTATFNLPGSALFSTYFTGNGTFSTSTSNLPFGIGPTVIISASAIPEPSTFAVILGAVMLGLVSARRPRPAAQLLGVGR